MLSNELNELQDRIMPIPEDVDLGLTLEVDLEISEDKHDFFNEYVPAPEHVKVIADMLSPQTRNVFQS